MAVDTAEIIERKIGAFAPLEFEVDLSSYGKTDSDVADIFFSVKESLTDDDDALLLKKFTDTGGITFTGTTILTVTVAWNYNEYAQFTAGQEYHAGLFVKFTGDPVADENVSEKFKVKILQDFLKDN